jgi:hypothetical protein
VAHSIPWDGDFYKLPAPGNEASNPERLTHGQDISESLVEVNLELARAPLVLQAHLAQLVGASLGLGNGKRDGSDTLDGPVFASRSALVVIHRSFYSLSERLNEMSITDI